MFQKFVFSALTAGLVSLTFFSTASAAEFILKDPIGDDKGPGNYEYPTDAVYTPGSFDMTSVSIKEKGKNVEFKVTINAAIEDPWNSKSWNGNGFSVQFIQIYLDLDHKEGSGETTSLPGINLKFPAESAWDKVVLISPQPKVRLLTEIDAKAASVKDKVVIPKATRSQGNTFIALVSAKDLGGSLPSGFGVQVVMQSNEGYPAPTDLLTRKVNEYKAQHRFGGGNDYDCDPHAIDILVAPAKGEDAEKEAQYEVLKKFTCDEDPKKWVLAVVPMVYPSAN